MMSRTWVPTRLLLWSLCSLMTVLWFASTTTNAAVAYEERKVSACLDPQRSERSMCLWSSSCDNEFMTVASKSMIENDGAIKTIVCDSDVELQLVYAYDSIQKTCAYSGSLEIPNRIRIAITDLPATQIWNHTTVDVLRTDPHVTVQGDKPLCAFLKSQSTYECLAPFFKANPFDTTPPAPVPETNQTDPFIDDITFCSPLSSINIPCGSQLIRCEIETTMVEYRCMSLQVSTAVAFVTPFDMFCSRVPLEQIRGMWNESLLETNQIPNPSFCAKMGRGCVQRVETLAAVCEATPLSPLCTESYFADDVFRCDEPFFGPFNTTLCDLLPTHAQVQVSCFGQSIVAYSAFGRNQTHTARYRDGFLNLFCSVPESDFSSVLGEVYRIADDLEPFQTNSMHMEFPQMRRRLLSWTEEHVATAKFSSPDGPRDNDIDDNNIQEQHDASFPQDKSTVDRHHHRDISQNIHAIKSNIRQWNRRSIAHHHNRRTTYRFASTETSSANLQFNAQYRRNIRRINESAMASDDSLSAHSHWWSRTQAIFQPGLGWISSNHSLFHSLHQRVQPPKIAPMKNKDFILDRQPKWYTIQELNNAFGPSSKKKEEEEEEKKEKKPAWPGHDRLQKPSRVQDSSTLFPPLTNGGSFQMQIKSGYPLVQLPASVIAPIGLIQKLATDQVKRGISPTVEKIADKDMILLLGQQVMRRMYHRQLLNRQRQIVYADRYSSLVRYGLHGEMHQRGHPPQHPLIHQQSQATPVLRIPHSFAESFATQQQQQQQQRQQKHQRQLLSLTEEELLIQQSLVNEFACNYLINTCGTDLNCTTDALTDVNARKSRVSFCTTGIAQTCRGFTDLPAVPVSPIAQISPRGEVFKIQCIKSRLPTIAYHNIQCAMVPDYTGIECFFRCLVNDPFSLQMSAFPVPANVLLSQNLTEAEKCAAVAAVAQGPDFPLLVGTGLTNQPPRQTVVIPNAFFCQTPFETVRHFNATRGSFVIDDICIETDQVATYSMLCGDMTLNCSLVGGQFVYQCKSLTYDTRLSLPATTPYLLSRPTVPLSIVSTAHATTTLNQRCVELRDEYTQVDSSTFYSCPTTTGSNNSVNRTDTATIFCTSTIDSSQLVAATAEFTCGDFFAASSSLERQDVDVACFLESLPQQQRPFVGGLRTYTCTGNPRSVYRPSTDSLVPVARAVSTDLDYLRMHCTGLGAYTLLITLGLLDLTNNPDLENQESVSQSLHRCMIIKELCQGDTVNSTFVCSASFAQDNSQQQFCNHRSVAPLMNETISCGTLPRHTINCINRDTAAQDWLRCRDVDADDDLNELLTMDCSIRISQFNSVVAQSNSSIEARDALMCELFRTTCGTPISCNTSLVGFCPVPSTSQLDCDPPAEICQGAFCQLEALGGTGNNIVPIGNACQFQPAAANLTCGTDGNFLVQCVRINRLSVSRSDVLYRCFHLYNPFDDGFESAGRDLNMDCEVPLSDLNFQAQPFHTCLRIGRRCLAAGQLECSRKFVATVDQPFCQIASNPADIGGVFTCNDLVVECFPASFDINRVRCQSLVNSQAWILQENFNSLDFPTPIGERGCVLSPRNFFLNIAERCGVLFTTCRHTCTGGLNTAPNANVSSPAFCDSFTDNHRQFSCDGQTILCTVRPLPTGAQSITIPSSDVPLYILNAEVDRQRRELVCTKLSGPGDPLVNSLELNCRVNKFIFTQRPDVCQTLLSECINNLGTIRCLTPYVSTNDKPFCTTVVGGAEADQTCDCGVWWSKTQETAQYMPEALRDVSCHASDFAFLTGVTSTILTFRLQKCRQEAQTHPLGISCARRGLVSYEDYLKFKYGDSLYLNHARNLFVLHGRGYQKNWCLWSVARPVAYCSTKPGQFEVPLCTIECPVGLTRMSINGSASHYCCRDTTPGRCTLRHDARNCVLGRHDPTSLDDPRILYAQLPYQAYVPNNTCPLNLFWEETVYPVTQSRPAVSVAQQFAKARTLCHSDYRCHGHLVVDNTDQPFSNQLQPFSTRGLYFMSRAPVFPIDFLHRDDPQREHLYDTEARYHLHRVPNSRIPNEGSPMFRQDDTFKQVVQTYVLERTYGYACSDDRFEWTYYLDQHPTAASRVTRRVITHLTQLGAGQELLTAMFYPTKKATIKTSNLHLATGPGPNSTIVFLNAPFLVIDLELEPRRDILFAHTIDDIVPVLMSLNLTLNDALSVSSQQLINRMSSDFVRQHHVYYDMVRERVPLFGDRDGNFKRSLQMYPDLADEFMLLGVGMASLDDITLAGLWELRNPSLQQIRSDSSSSSAMRFLKVERFWHLFEYFAWRDYVLFGGTRTRGTNRVSPNARCILNTPLWSSNPDQDGGAFCATSNCPLPVDPNWDWGQVTATVGQPSKEGSSGLVPLYPNPRDDQIQYLADSIPCGGKGWCEASQRKCHPDPAFKTETGMLDVLVIVNGVRRVPRSKTDPAYNIDIRGKCTNPTRGVTSVCSSRGSCVVTFVNNRQTAECACGNFPVDPDPSLPQTVACNNLPSRTCEIHRLSWIPTGFDEATFGQNLCRVPQRGCRDTDDWQRSQGNQFIRGDSCGCAVPCGDTSVMRATGVCESQGPLDTTDPQYRLTASRLDWKCRCFPGNYGDSICKYVTLESKCYSATVERSLQQKGKTLSSRETDCIWNAHLAQWEVEAESNIPLLLRTNLIPRSRCRGVACSGHGQCTHVGMDDRAQEVYTGDPNDALFNYVDLGIMSPQEQTFTNRVFLRQSAQNCTCDPGWTGPFCSVADCIGGCLNGGICQQQTQANSDSRIKATCACPRRRDGILLVQGERCEGPVCGGHGLLVSAANGFFACNCTAPYYQGSVATASQLCSKRCDPPGQLQTRVATDGRVTQICACTIPGSTRQVDCNILSTR
jgi:hypothetical protein